VPLNSDVRHMQMSDLSGALVSAIVLGGFAFAVLSHTLKNPRRAAVIRWCFLVGAVGAGMLGSFAILDIQPPSKSAIGLVFVALPALVCGLLLSLQNSIAKARNDNNQA